jgi:hypothetical protein
MVRKFMGAREHSGLGWIGRGIMLALLGSAVAMAQAARLQDVLDVLRENDRQLRRYAFKLRTEIRVADELLQVSLTRASYDGDGALIETALPGETVSPPTGGKLPKKVRAFHEELCALTRSYVDLDPRRMRDALAGAHAWEGQGERGELLRIQARGVIRQADRLELWVDSATDRPRRLEVLTSMRGEPVRLEADFEQLEGGPSYAAVTRVETELKEKRMVIRTESVEHVELVDPDDRDRP